MKKALIASTILATLGGAAYAETGVNISGFGRFGLQYNSEAGDGEASTVIHTRLRFNIDAKTETDTGVTFGGRIRLQDQSGYSSTAVSSALLYATYEGLRVEVGNVNTALDSVELFYDSEMGLIDSSYGDSRSDFYSFSTGHYNAERMGIYASYTVGGFTGRLSYVDPNQYDDSSIGYNSETSLALTYSAGAFTVAAAGTWDGAGIEGNDIFFIGGAYKVSDVATVGLNYIDEGEDGAGGDLDKTIVIYGNYTMDALTLKGYISHNGLDSLETNTGLGIGADYDLGGAKLTGSIQRDYNKETYADVGVRFDF
ncbi:MAG: porin [Paracoccaceae bacterium]